MRWTATSINSPDIYSWHAWFAWHPIKISVIENNVIKDGGTTVWLETVERYRFPGMVGAGDVGCWVYRVHDQSKAKGLYAEGIADGYREAADCIDAALKGSGVGK